MTSPYHQDQHRVAMAESQVGNVLPGLSFDPAVLQLLEGGWGLLLVATSHVDTWVTTLSLS